VPDPERLARERTRRVPARPAARPGAPADRAAAVATPPVDPAAELVSVDSMALIAALPEARGEAAPLEPAQAVVGETRTIYTVLRLLDQGGMGAVYEARDGSLNRTVALKVMRRDQDQGSVARFIEEAQLTSQLEHPNIVPLHELGVDADGRLFFAMKLIRGETLAARLVRWNKQPLSAALVYEAMTLVVKVCDALAYAHDRGVVHRDIKPANIMIGAYGEVVVMDWGVARIHRTGPVRTERAARAGARSARRGDEVSVDPTVMTQDGEVVGTPGYMPPEQARGDTAAIGPAADVYAVGAVIYELLTGTPPVRGRTLTEIISRTISASIRRPSLAREDRAIPAQLEAVAMKALAAEPSARYANARALSLDLQAFLAGRSVSALKDGFWPAVRRLVRRNRGIAGTLGASALAMLLVATVAFTRVLSERDLARRASDDAQLALVKERLADETARSALTLAAESDRRRGASERAEAETLKREAERAVIRAKAFVPYAQGLDLLQRGGFGDETTRLLREAMGIDADFAEAAFACGRALRQAGDPGGAAKAFLDADAISRRTSGQSSPPALLEAAFANDDAQNYVPSLAEFTSVANSAPTTCIGQVARCFVTGEEEDFLGSLEAARRALAIEPRMWEAHFALGYALLNGEMSGVIQHSGRPSPVDELRTAVRMAPGRGEPLTWLGIALMQSSSGNRAEALQLFAQAVADEPRNPARYCSHAAAIAALVSPDDPHVRESMAKAEALGMTATQRARTNASLARARNDHAAALAESLRIPEAERMPQDTTPMLIARLNAGLDDGLLREIDDNLRAHPDSPFARLLAGGAAIRSRRWDAALAETDAGIRIAPYSVDLLAQRCIVLVQLMRNQDAIDQADAVLRLAPACHGAMEAKVVALIRLQRQDEAHALYRTLVAAYPPAKDNLGRMVGALGW
jgi:serine/threonine protein kinase/tetratricopeptide (TPR) repeat protein